MKEDDKASLLLLLFYVLLFFKFRIVDAFSFLGIAVSFGYLSLAISVTLYFFFCKLKKYPKIHYFIFLMFVFGYSTSIFTENYRVNDYILNFQYFGIALIPLFYRLNYDLFKFALIALLVFFIVNVVEDVNPNDIFSVSRNNISVFLLIFYGNYVIAAYQNNKNIELWLLIICFLISIWAVGRGGIIAIGLLLVLTPYCKYKHFTLKLIIIYLCFLLVIGFFITMFSDTLLSLAISRFDSMGFDSNGRDEPNTEYLKLVFDSYFNFVYGVSLPGIGAFEALDLNPHNSLIRLHIYYGIGGFLLVAIYFLRSLVCFLKTKNYMYMLLLVALLFRSLVDSTAFHGPFDGLIYYFLFYKLYDDNYTLKTVANV